MQFTNEWKEEGRLEGRSEELREGLSLLLHRLYGERAASLISQLPTSNLESLRHLQQQLKAGADLDQLVLLEP